MTVIVLLFNTVCKLSEPQLLPSFLFWDEGGEGPKKKRHLGMLLKIYNDF